MNTALKVYTEKSEGLILQLLKLKKDISVQCAIDESSQDARLVALNGIIEAIRSSMDILNCIDIIKVNRSSGNTFNDERMIFFKEMPDSEFEYRDENMTKSVKLQLLISIHFILENLFTNLLKELNKNTPLRIKSALEGLLDEIRITNEDEKNKFVNDLKVLSSFRNCLHNNAIHRHNDFSHAVFKKEYIFVKDSTVSFNIFDVKNVVIANVENVKRILLSNKIVSIKKIVKDDFASTFQA